MKVLLKAIGMRLVGVAVLSAGICTPALAGNGSGNSVNFGNATVGGTAVVMTVPLTNYTVLGSVSATVGAEFTLGQVGCTNNGCSVPVTFTPKYPGLRRDAIVTTDSSGQVVGKVFVYGVGMAPQFGYQIGNLSVYYGFTNSPLAVALGPDEMVYYTSTGANTIYKAARDISSATTLILNGLQTPSGIAVDGSNTLYVADSTGNQIISYDAAGVQGTVATSPLSGPSQIAVDGTGALYVADTGNGRIIKIDNQGVETTLASGLNAPVAVTVSSAGDVFFADSGNNGEILEIAAGTNTATSFQSNLSAIPFNLAVEASGTVFLTTDQGLRYFGSGYSTGYGATPTSASHGLALAADGDVFTTEPGNGTFSITDRQSSNFILGAPPRVMTSGSLGITNTGNTPLTFSSFATNGPEFTVDPASECTPNGVLQPGTQCNVTIDFTPPLPRRYTDTMIAVSDSLNVPGTFDPFDLAADPAGVQGTYVLTESVSGTQVGNPVTFTATVTGNSQFTPNGTVTFMDADSLLGTANLTASATPGVATATLTTSSLTVGVHSILFTFPGDNDVNPGTSNTVTETIFSPPTVSDGGIDAKDFGQAPINGPTSSMMLVYAPPAGGLTFTLAGGLDFSLSGATCSSQCSVVVTFAPHFPGLRKDALVAKDTGGNVAATVFLQGNGVGPQTGFTIGTETEYGLPAQQPAGIAQGPDGTLYVSDQGTKKVYPLKPDFSDGTALNFGNMGTPGALAVDGNKTVYVIDQTNNVVLALTAAGVVSTVATSSLSSPSYLLTDGTGALYISDTGNGRILKIDNQGNEITLLNGLNSPEGMALDAAGDFFFVDRGNGGEIQEMMPGGDPVSVRQNIDPAIQAIALDAGGSYYYTAGTSVTMISTSGTGFSYTANASQPLFGLLVDQAGRYIYTSPGSPLFSVHDRAVDLIGFDVPVGQTGAFTRGVSNTGNAPLVLSNLTFTGPYSLDPSNPCGVGSAIAGGAFCQVDIDFSPTTQQAYQGSLTVGANSLNVPSNNVLTLFGNGTAALAPSTTTLTVSSHSINANQTLTLTATVADMMGVMPTGSVEFDDGATVLGEADLPPGAPLGTAIGTFSGLQLSPGTHSITAHYFGDGNVAPSTSAPQTVMVFAGGGSPGPGVVDSKDFGSAPVGGQPVTMNLSYGPFAGVSNLAVSVRANNDFIVQSSVCVSSCNVVVAFTPLYPGVRKDVIVVRDANTGDVLATTFVYGVGTGPLFGFDVGSNSILNSIEEPSGIAVSPDNLATVIGDIGTNSVYVVTGGSTNPLPIMGLGTPAGVAVDADGTVFVADQTNGVIVTYNLDSQVQGSIPVQLNQPVGVAVDGAGNLYVTDAGNSRVLKIDNQLNVTTLASGVANLGPIAVDSAGNVYYAITAQPGGVIELPVGGGQPITIANNIGSIHGIAVDAAGRVNYNNDAGLSIIPLFNCPVNCNIEGPGFPGLVGILNGVALNGNGDIYVTQTGTGQYAISHRATGVQPTTAIIGNTSQVTFIVSNTGTNPLTISGLSITGSVFTLDAASQCVVGAVLIPGQICNAVIDFHPAAVQQYHEVVSFTSNSLNNAASVNSYDLYGTGTPGLTPSTTTLTITPSNNVTTAQTENFTVTVTSGTQVTPTGQVTIVSGGSINISSGPLTATATPGTATFVVNGQHFPVGTYNLSAAYQGDSNFQASNSAQQTLTVTQAAPAVIKSQNFGSVAVGQSVSMNILYTQGTNPTITTVGGQDFQVTSQTCNTGCTVTINFAPLFPGLRDDAVLVTDSTGALLAKTYVYGTGTGPQFGFNPGGVSLNSSLQVPVGVAFTQDGVAYITDAATNKVYPQVQGGTALPITGLGQPAGIAADGGHTLYVADKTHGVIVTYSLLSGVQGVLSTTPLLNPGGVAVDGTGAVYISDNGNNRVIKVDNQGTETTLASGLNSPEGIAVDAAGDVFYADSGSGGEIVELPVGGGQAIQLGTSLGTVAGIALDASGSVYYVGNFLGIRILEPGGGTLSFRGSIFGTLTGIGINLNGDIWTTQPSTGQFEQMVRSVAGFGVTSPVGTSYQQAGPQVFNMGNAPLTISGVSLATGTVFTLDSTNACATGTVVAPGKACNAVVDFLPTAAQNYTDSLKFTSNSLNVAGSTNVDAEFGTGLAPVLAPSTTTLSVSSISVVFGQPLTLTATVSDASQITPTGVVQFVNNGNVFASVNLVASATPGTATAQGTFTTLPPGSYSIVAMYGGDSNVQASSSAAQTVTITAAPTSTTLAVTSANLIQGQSETLTATISGFLFPAMTGTVNFFDGSTAIGSSAVTATNQGGTAALSVGVTLTVGAHQFSAVYSGDANYLTSTSASTTVTVTAAPTVINAQNFGTSTVSQQTVTRTLSYATVPGGITIALVNGVDFTSTAQSCAGGTCSVDVSFRASFPGLRNDAVTVKDTSGNLVDETFIYGAGVGPQFAFDEGLVNFPFPEQQPTGLAVGPDRTIYVADAATDAVYAHTLANNNGPGTPIPVGNLGSPGAIAVDGSNTVYIVDTKNSALLASSAAGVSTVATTSPGSLLAVDGTGALYIADPANSIIVKRDNQGNQTTLASGIAALRGLAVDAAGDVFYTVSGGNGGQIIELPVGGGSAVTVASNLASTIGQLAVDASGRIYFLDHTSVDTDLYLLTPGSTPVLYPLSGAGSPASFIALDPAARILISETGPGQVAVYDRSLDNQSVAVQVGSTTQANVPVSNTGNASLGFIGNSITGTTFTVAPATTCTSGSGLAAGHVCNFVLTFAPAAVQNYAENLTVITNSLNAASASNVETLFGQGLGGITSATTLVAAPGNATVGQLVTLTATVSSGTQVVPTGAVNFLDGQTVIGSGNLGSSTGTGTAQAQFATSALALGSHSITAAYAGDTSVAASASAAQIVVVSAAQAVATATTLTATPATVAYEQPITLTAVVQTSLGAAVGVGQVIFCDANAAQCNLMLNLGSAQLNTAGIAVLRLPGATIGAHNYHAIFVGTNGFAGSSSNTPTVTVTGVYPSSTTISAVGSGPFDLTGTVVGLGARTFGPTGSVAFNDTSNTTTPLLGTVALGAATLGFSTVQPQGSPVSVGAGAYGVASGDFNGDGFADIAVGDYLSNRVSVLLGNGDGTFRAAVSYPVGAAPERVLVADFNGDGKLDLVVANTGSNTVTVLLGNGDGTFAAAVPYPVFSPVGLGVQDLNHDGIADIVATDYYSNTVSVLIGNGDGTFKAAVTYPTGTTPQTLAEGDFNGDGNVDLAVGNFGSNTVSIFLGNGDGTFQAQVPYPVGHAPQGVQVGDFNGDGKADLVVSNSGDGTVGVLLGNGDGTFQAQVPYTVGASPVGIVVADFNGDGKADISVGNTGPASLTQSVLLGNGDGTFQAQKTYPTGNFPYGAAAADFNGDGYPDLAVTNFNDGTASILLTRVTETATATLTGVTLGGVVGTHNVGASYAGDTNFGASTSTTIPLVIQLASQTITFPAIPAHVFGDAPFALGATASSGLPVSYTVTSGPATVVGSTVTLTGAGSVTITASQAGNASFAAAAPMSQTFVVAQASQTITFPAIPNHIVTDAPFGLNATASSGLAVAYSVVSGPAMVSGATVTLTGAGTVVIQASQAGNANYAAATAVSQSFNVALVTQTITFGTIPNHVFGDAPFALNATASSQLAVSYAVVSGPATVAGNTVTLTGAGTVVIQATQAGDTTYAAAAPMSQNFTVAQAAQTITFPAIPNHAVGDPPFSLNATASSGLAVTYTVVSGPATVAGSTVTLSGQAGTVVIQAAQAGNANYLAAPAVSQSFTVALQTQTITFPAIPNHNVGDAPFALNATASSGLAVTYSVVSGPATVAGSTVTLTGQTGTVVIQAAQAGNSTYAAATAVNQSFVVAALTPTLTSISPASGVIGSSATTITLTGTNFNSSDTAQLNGTAIATTFVNATTLTAVLPASFFATAGTGQITVFDAGVRATSGALPFVVQQTPALVFTGPTTAGSGTQPTATLTLTNPYPFPLTGVITLTFTPSGVGASDDPAVQFAGGGRTINFTIPAQSTTTPAIQLQTGTVAGTATITLVVTSNGVNVTPATVTPVVIRIPTAVPTITTAGLTRSGTSLTVSVVGFSNTRDVATAIFHFIPADGSTVSTPDITADVTTVFANYFASAASVPYGSTFVYTQNFTLNNDASTIKSVTVTLVNSVGQSLQVSTP